MGREARVAIMPAAAATFDLALPPLPLEAGGVVSPHVVRGWSHGPEGAPVVLLVHALTGDAAAGAPGGWWEPLIGEGRALDPASVRVVCFNNLGSCYGTSGPHDPRFPAGPLTTWDQARSLLLALDALGVQRVALVAGGSLGGMLALCLAALAPERFERLLCIAATEASSSWVVGFNHVQAEALRLGGPEHGLALARQIAMLTYRAENGLEEQQGRPRGSPMALSEPHRVRSYLDYQGEKLVARFDARSYRAQLDAMDHHDLDRPPPQPSKAERWRHGPGEAGVWGVARVRASSLLVGIDSDQLFFPSQVRRLGQRLRERGIHTELALLHSLNGHDAFLIEWEQLDVLLRRALRLPAPGTLR